RVRRAHRRHRRAYAQRARRGCDRRGHRRPRLAHGGRGRQHPAPERRPQARRPTPHLPARSKIGGPMPGYVIAEVDVTDPTVFEEYRKQVPATVQKYGGKFLARGGTVDSLEGGGQPKRLVLLELPAVEEAGRRHAPREAA